LLGVIIGEVEVILFVILGKGLTDSDCCVLIGTLFFNGIEVITVFISGVGVINCFGSVISLLLKLFALLI
jgi:hypothetical protein